MLGPLIAWAFEQNEQKLVGTSFSIGPVTKRGVGCWTEPTSSPIERMDHWTNQSNAGSTLF